MEVGSQSGCRRRTWKRYFVKVGLWESPEVEAALASLAQNLGSAWPGLANAPQTLNAGCKRDLRATDSWRERLSRSSESRPDIEKN